ncbi:hypothetical protein VP01_956g5 [Puccinia sorghi]|uniref:Uncharacterized protein n=1 Tax=Puccinia sorghi TaxID=27349 RepID=A0A0L6U6S7_9BASI|nr:hypothetical protein VP01_956g5 [Puccinia sorghi]
MRCLFCKFSQMIATIQRSYFSTRFQMDASSSSSIPNNNKLVTTRLESHGHPPYSSSPWITSPSSACGLNDLEPDSSYLSQEQVHLLQRALTESPPGFQHRPSSSSSSSPSPSPSSLSSSPSSSSPPSEPHSNPSLEIFLILDNRNARVLFSHSSPSSAAVISDYQYCPEDYAYFAMQSTQQKLAEINYDNHHNKEEEHLARTNCSRELTARHQLAMILTCYFLTVSKTPPPPSPALKPCPISNSSPSQATSSHHHSNLYMNLAPSHSIYIHPLPHYLLILKSDLGPILARKS